MEFFDFQKFKTAINPILKFYNCKNYHISYFGGEPLENWGIIEQSLPLFSKDPDCKSIVLISNGLLLDPPKVEFLKRYKCGLSWSFDGLWSYNRPLANGEDSLLKYEAIMPLALQLTNSCKAMVQANCFNSLVENLKYFISKNIFHPDFSLVRDNIYRPEHIELYKLKCKELADFIIETNQKSQEVVSVGVFTLYTLDTLAAKLYGKRKFGCFVGSNGILYAYDGSIWPCERFRSSNKLCLAKPLKSTSTEENCVYSYDYETLEKLKQVSDTHKIPKCQSCELYEYCNTGCTFNELEKLKSNLIYDFEKPRKPLDSVCELFKITYKNALYVFENAGKSYQNFILGQL